MKKLIFLVGVVTGAAIAYFGMRRLERHINKCSQTVQDTTDIFKKRPTISGEVAIEYLEREDYELYDEIPCFSDPVSIEVKITYDQHNDAKEYNALVPQNFGVVDNKGLQILTSILNESAMEFPYCCNVANNIWYEFKYYNSAEDLEDLDDNFNYWSMFERHESPYEVINVRTHDGEILEFRPEDCDSFSEEECNELYTIACMKPKDAFYNYNLETNYTFNWIDVRYFCTKEVPYDCDTTSSIDITYGDDARIYAKYQDGRQVDDSEIMDIIAQDFHVHNYIYDPEENIAYHLNYEKVL